MEADTISNSRERRRVAGLLLALLLLDMTGGCSTENADPKPHIDLAVTDVTVIDPSDGKVRPGMTVLISGKQIAQVGKASKIVLSAGTRVVDGKSKYLIPGLWNMHLHAGSYEDARAAVPQLFQSGVTGVRDMGAPLEDALRLRAEFRTEAGRGPHLVVAGPLVQGPLPFQSSLMIQVKDPGEAAATVAMLRNSKVDFLKIHDAIPHDIYVAVAREANIVGLPIAGHIPPTVSVWETIAAHQRSIEHFGGQFLGILIGASSMETELSAITTGFYEEAIDALKNGKEPDFPQFRRPFLRAVLSSYDDRKAAKLFASLVAADVWQCPTLTAIGKLWEDHADSLTEEEKALNGAVFEKHRALIGKMRAAGVHFLAGTDGSYAAGGRSLHDEIILLSRAGLGPIGALRAATSAPAEFLGLAGTTGRIAPGMRADIVLLGANPIAEIENVRNIRAVIIEGDLVYARGDGEGQGQ